MASREFILKRISGAEDKISKLTAKLERISKAEATDWEVNPYGYHEYDKRYTLKDLEEAQTSLAKYQAQLAQEDEKSLSRNVPAITEFLNAWKARLTEFYMKRFAEYPAAYAQYQEDLKPFYDVTYYQERKMSKEDPEGYKEWKESKELIKRRFEDRFGCLAPYLERAYDKAAQKHFWKMDTDKLERDLTEEYNRKYDFIIERTNEIVGQITDASHLEVGEKGDLNGYIIGTKGTAKVQTIGAGGYNIQCFHFRTLINRWDHPTSFETQTTAKKHEKLQEAKKIPVTQNYAGKSIEELKSILDSLGGSCKVYDNEKIYRMRLIMAIKKVG